MIPQFKAAVDRGVIVDIAHGRSSFSYDTCQKALDQGMPIHTISSDLHKGNIDRYVVSLARTMSKFRSLGLSLEDVIKAVTVTPANALNLTQRGFGTLEPGKLRERVKHHVMSADLKAFGNGHVHYVRPQCPNHVLIEKALEILQVQ